MIYFYYEGATLLPVMKTYDKTLGLLTKPFVLEKCNSTLNEDPVIPFTDKAKF